MMQVHRCRFVEWQPEPIVSLAWSKDGDHGVLAVVRQNNTIELRDAGAAWACIACIPGSSLGEDRDRVRCVTWAPPIAGTHGTSRLFTSGFDGRITEWDLQGLVEKSSCESFGGAVWALQADPTGKVLAAACADGSIRLFRTDDGYGGLAYWRAYAQPKRGAALCLCWHPDGTHVAAGHERGDVYVWSVSSGQQVCHMRAEAIRRRRHGGRLGVPKIWSICMLRDHTLVTGTSGGSTLIWDGRFGTLIGSYASHKGDVLCTGATADGRYVFSTGMEGKVALWRKSHDHIPVIAAPSGASDAVDDAATPNVLLDEWIAVGTQRAHTHDVWSLACRGDRIVTGGVDTRLAVYVVEDAWDSFIPERVSSYPAAPVVALAPPLRLLSCQHADAIRLWRLGATEVVDVSPDAEGGERLPLSAPFVPLTELRTSGGKHIVCSALCPTGAHIAMAVRYHLSVYHVSNASSSSSSSSSSSARVRVRKVTQLPDAMKSADVTALVFSHDGDIMCFAQRTGVIQLWHTQDWTLAHSLVWKSTASTATAATSTTTSSTMNDTYTSNECIVPSSVSMLRFSSCGQWLAVCDTAGHVVTYAITETGVRLRSRLPVFEQRIVAVRFHPSKTNHLLLATQDNRFRVWDVSGGGFDAWTQKNVTRLPGRLVKRRDCLVDFVVHPARASRVGVWAEGFLAFVDTADNLPTRPTRQQRKAALTKAKRAMERGDGEDDDAESVALLAQQRAARERDAALAKRFQLIDKFSSLLFAGFLGPKEMVVVERPWLDVMQSFPAPLAVPRYGVE